MKLSQKKLFYLGLFTLFGFSAIGFVLLYFFQNRTPIDLFKSNIAISYQLLYGFALGTLSAGLAILLLRLSYFEKELHFFGSLIQNLVPYYWQIFFYASCAGIGEEILFRGAIQPLIGLWPTSIIFILVHGYLNPKKPALFVYGILMVFIAAGMGWFFIKFGIFAAIIAHTIFDIIIFFFLRFRFSATKNTPHVLG